jgi:homoaconitase/3-isopropylmalate dehydratase large subunit
MTQKSDAFAARARLTGSSLTVDYYRLGALATEGGVALDRLPVTVKILLENVLRHQDKVFANAADVLTLARWNPKATEASELPFLPSRVVLQDFTGVPAVVDLAAMRDAVARAGGDPERINPLVPADLVIDHSVQVDAFGSPGAFAENVAREHERNRERYLLLRWGQKAFKNFRVVPPGTGIVHQVNLEFLASVVDVRAEGGTTFAFPDTLVGTDSHTTMINGLGVLGWGVGGIEAEAVLLGQPLYQLLPVVVGCRLTGQLPSGTTATDLVLTITQMLRKHGVVGKFVEFFGTGCADLGLADRATIANMAPEYGATAGLFPVDDETLRYLRATGREPARVDLVERYCKEQGLFRTAAAPEPTYSEVVGLDLGTVEPSLAGPRRPQDRAPLAGVKASFRTAYEKQLASANGGTPITSDGRTAPLKHGGVVIAAITSCTNTSNPSVMLAAGLLAKKAVARGLKPKPYVKTSLAPGSRVVTEYLRDAGLLESLDALKFDLVGYGCTTCIAAGTPVLMANGMARRIEHAFERDGGELFGPTTDDRLAVARRTRTIDQGRRECVALTFEDGRTLVCTPDHELRCRDGRWVRADALSLSDDAVLMGLEAPLDEPGIDEIEYCLRAGDLRFALAGPDERARTLAFARLLGHLLGDGSISVMGQGRMNVGQALDRELVLRDIERITGKRPKGSRYDDRKWSIALPRELTAAITALTGVPVGRRIHQIPTLPAFVLDERCPIAVVREFVAGAFGADGHAPLLHRYGTHPQGASLEAPAYSQTATPEYVPALKAVMQQMIGLLARCGVATDGARVYEYPVRRASSSYPDPEDGVPRVEVRLTLPDGLSFIEWVGFRYCADKALRATAAAVYWRMLRRIDHQRLWMSARIERLHRDHPELPRACRAQARASSRTARVSFRTTRS